MILLGFVALMLVQGCVQPPIEPPEDKTVVNIPKFSSCSAIAAEFEKSNGYGYYGLEEAIGMPMMAMDAESGGSRQNFKSAPDYSETNVQVEGVDEADIVKTDGEFIYVISNNKLHIVLGFAEIRQGFFKQR